MSIRSSLKITTTVFLIGLAFAQTGAFAEGDTDEAMDRAGVSDGEAAARLGTDVYNHANPDTPLPRSSGDVVNQMFNNMGRGEGTKEAWGHAAESASGQGGGGGGNSGNGNNGSVSRADRPQGKGN